MRTKREKATGESKGDADKRQVSSIADIFENASKDPALEALFKADVHLVASQVLTAARVFKAA